MGSPTNPAGVDDTDTKKAPEVAHKTGDTMNPGEKEQDFKDKSKK